MSASAEAITTLARHMPADRVEDAAQLIRQESLPKLSMMATEIARIRSSWQDSPITSDVEAGRAAELISRGEIAVKELTDLRRKHVDPLNEEVKAINGLFKLLTEPLLALVEKGGPIEEAILAWRAQERARVQREQEAAQKLLAQAAEREAAAIAEAEAAVTDFARRKALAAAENASRSQSVLAFATPRTPTKGIKTDSGSVTESNTWVFEIVDPNQVPREFCVPDGAKIRAAIAAGTRQLAGVHIYPKPGLTRRR